MLPRRVAQHHFGLHPRIQTASAPTEAMLPQSPPAVASLSVASRFYSPALLNHCVRSYLWGTGYAAAHSIAFDDELYYVAAMLHDIGLTDAFDSHTLPFEEA